MVTKTKRKLVADFLFDRGPAFFENGKIAISVTIWGVIKGNIRISSFIGWNIRGRLHINDN